MSRVKCPNCGKVHWETTEAYDPDSRPNGSMLRLLDPWKTNHWPIFGDGVMPKTDGTGTSVTPCAELDCISCLSQLAPSGHLMVVLEEVPEEGPEEVPEEVPEEAKGSDDLSRPSMKQLRKRSSRKG